METPEKFAKDVERANYYEMFLAKQILKNNDFRTNETGVLVDRRKDVDYQQRDIDFTIEWGFPTKRTFSIEAKIDFTSLPNFFFEIGRTTGTLGAIMATEADEIWYYFVETKKLYRFSTKELKEYLTKTLNELKEIDERKGKQEGMLPGELEKLTWYKPATGKTNSIGLAIPIESVIKDLCVVIDDYGVKT